MPADPAYLALLTERQSALYEDVCDVIRVTTPLNPEGDETFSVIARNVPYWHGPTRNLEEPTVAGREIVQNIYTVDEGHFSAKILLLPSDGYIVNRTAESKKNGLFYRFEGPARLLDSPGPRVVQSQFMDLRWDEHPHPDLVTVANS